jgi:hypothetical protein
VAVSILEGSSGLTATSEESDVVMVTELEFVDRPMRISGSEASRKYSYSPEALTLAENTMIAARTKILRGLIH